MNILVNGNALTEKGGIAVINSFIYDLENHPNLSDRNINVTIIVPDRFILKNIKNRNIKLINLNLKTKGYLRKIENNFKVRNIIKSGNFNAYLSLQNTAFRKIDIPQYVLIHTALPFVNIPLKYNLFKYRFLLKFYYKINMKYYDGIFVQSNWLKKIINESFNFEQGKIYVVRPTPNDIKNNTDKLDCIALEKLNSTEIKLLYPTRNAKYKNIERLIEAINKYNYKNKIKVILYLTYKGKDSKYIKFIGNIRYESIATLYKNVDAIIFPSLVETLGLPLQESQILNKDILVSDLEYAREVLGKEGYYFNPYDIDSIVNCIKKYIMSKKNKKKYDKVSQNNLNYGYFIDVIYGNLSREKE